MYIEFLAREGEPSSYNRPYQFQFVTKEEKELYIPILKEVFPNYDELAKLWFEK